MHVLDTTVLLGGRERPPGPCATTPEAVAEIQPGGRDARRLEAWLAAGLEVRAPAAGALARVREAAAAAGSLPRLSAADVSVLALALEQRARLLSDDHTVLDVAARLGIDAAGFGAGIKGTIDWQWRCTGCGRRFPGPRDDCPVCGSPLRARPA